MEFENNLGLGGPVADAPEEPKPDTPPSTPAQAEKPVIPVGVFEPAEVIMNPSGPISVSESSV